ncbi:hypothetical protein [Primorskyibacter sp. 2E233]|uniref:hypothetical protein n=1 Tax=Primorskyibacter sp. 2E233 TaxID=3413431 RepID=UPI003BF45652
MFEVIVENLAWPITLLVALFGFRREIRKGARKIEKIKFKDVEVSFSEELDAVEEYLDQVGLIKNRAISADEKPKGTSELLAMWGDLESKVRGMLEGDGRSDSGNFRSTLDILKSRGRLSDQQYLALDKLYTVRNMVIHLNKDEISEGEMHQFKLMVKNLESNLFS